MLDDVHWPSTSALIDEACGSTGNALLVSEGPKNDIRVLFVGLYYRGQRRAELEREYPKAYHPIDERGPRFRQLPDNPICTRTLFNYRHGNERDQTDWRPAGRKVDGEHYQPVVNVEYIDSNGATQHNASTRNAGDTTAVWTGRRLQTVHLAAAEENH